MQVLWEQIRLWDSTDSCDFLVTKKKPDGHGYLEYAASNLCSKFHMSKSAKFLGRFWLFE